MTYNPYNFIEIVLSETGVEDTGWAKEQDGISGKILRGVNNRITVIDTTDEYLDEDEVAGYLHNLGLAHLIPAMCPRVAKKIDEM